MKAVHAAIAASMLVPCLAYAAIDDEHGEWENVASQAISSSCQRAIGDVKDYLATKPTTSIMIVQDGKVLMSMGSIDKPSIVHSVRKSILAMMYGPYVEGGKIDLNNDMEQLRIDDVGGLLPIERKATVRDLLTARSGVYHPASNDGDDTAAAPARGSQQPGSYFLYNNWDFNAAGTVFEQQTHQDIYRAFAEQLATPLHFDDFDLRRQRRNGDTKLSQHLAYAFYLSTRDMARIGQLMLQHGRWGKRQIISEQWAAKITQTVTPAEEMHPRYRVRRHIDYGYLWWIPEEPEASPLAGTYTAWGYYGQFITVLPKLNMVISHKHDVPHGTKEPVEKVNPEDMLHIASVLADGHCGEGQSTQTAQQARAEASATLK